MAIINKFFGINLFIKEGEFSCKRDIKFGAITENSQIMDFPRSECNRGSNKAFKSIKQIISMIPVRIICFIIKIDKYYSIKRNFKYIKYCMSIKK